MSTQSTGMAPPKPQEEQPAPLSALPMEADPSGLTERAPALTRLLPDEALARALAGGDALAVHAALVARRSREPRGPLRDTLRELLAQQTLFAVSERPPWLGELAGMGVRLIGLRPPRQHETPFIATRVVRAFGVSAWPLSQHLVRHGREGKLEVLGRVPPSMRFRIRRWLSSMVLAAVGLALLAIPAVPFVMREVQLVNGLSRPVDVLVDGQLYALEPGGVRQAWVASLGGFHELEARWPGEEKPFERLSLSARQRNYYSVLGAAPLTARNPASEYRPTRSLDEQTGSLDTEERVVLGGGGWAQTVRVHVENGRWKDAGQVAQAVALADPSALRAREEAARCLMQADPLLAEEFARLLRERYPDDVAAQELSQDLFALLGKGTLEHYAALASEAPDSVQRALLHARAQPPEAWRDAYARVLERFPDSPEAKRALARLRLADGYPLRAVELLDEALVKSPESLGDVELRVRALVSLRMVKEASGALRQHVEGFSRWSPWELAVLAVRLERLAGPSLTQYVTQDLLSHVFQDSQENKVTLALLSGWREVKDEEIRSVEDTTVREALELTRLVLTDFEKAVAQASSAREAVLHRLPLEPAAVLALEFSRQGYTERAERLFGAHFALLEARRPLEAYVRSGEVQPRFPLLPPELLATAYLVRARAVDQDRFLERAYARWTDGLQGFARRALDSDYVDPVSRSVSLAELPQALRASTQGERFTGDAPAKERLGGRSPRPWKWP